MARYDFDFIVALSRSDVGLVYQKVSGTAFDPSSGRISITGMNCAGHLSGAIAHHASHVARTSIGPGGHDGALNG
ncbi:hypothetical protein N7462_009138 [Penicillium macrosclerotiorum]|uniref:uncharacterized protein n=1 Tax=Penicillium macrosclerotiorum TaxID=303699 RepID=UPI002546E9E7|nr:uncharacterized protein N7462_009138 [Penicillium macrosclerotiorum]KAJ5676241.1 hypothetical protein N7462_009138 [Penicillium macrosclerotiorum]